MCVLCDCRLCQHGDDGDGGHRRGRAVVAAVVGLGDNGDAASLVGDGLVLLNGLQVDNHLGIGRLRSLFFTALLLLVLSWSSSSLGRASFASPSVLLSSLIPDSILIPEPCSFSSLTLPPSRVMSDGANARLRSEEGRARGDDAAAAGGGIQAPTASKSKSSPHTTQDGRTRTEGERPTREEGNGLENCGCVVVVVAVAQVGGEEEVGELAIAAARK